MFRAKFMNKYMKGLLSLLLALLMMTSLGVPLSVSAEEEPATGDQIYALLYDIRSTSTANNWGGYELVIQRGNTPDADVAITDATQGTKRRVHVCTYPYNQFGASSLTMSNALVQARTPWYSQTPKTAKTPTGADLPGKECGNNSERLSRLITKITIKDKIKPESIAGWFCYCDYATEINNLDKIDTSICKDMRYAFYSVGSVKKLDLHTFDTSNVQYIDYFIYSSNALEEVDVSGFDLRNVQTLNTFIKGGYYSDTNGYGISKLNKVNFSGMDISKIREIKYFLTYTKDLEEITFDLNPRNAKDFLYAFLNNRGLKKFTFGSEGHLVQPGVDYHVTSSGERLVRFNNMFEGCIALEEVDFEYLDLPDYKNTASTEYTATDYIVPDQTDLLSNSRYYEYASMFKDCKSLTDLKHIENLFIEAGNCSSWTHRYMFDGCESLETLDLSKIHAYIGGPHIFRNCKSLKTLNLINLGTAFHMNSWFYSHNLRFQSNVNTGEEETNIFEGCTELSEVYLSPYYPPAANTILYKDSTVGCGNSCPPVDREWVKVELPDYYPDQYGFYKYAVYNGTNTSYKSLSEIETPTDTGDQKSTEKLFTEFKPEFAGRWVAVSKLNLKGNGGTPSIQQIKGAIGMTVDYQDGEITEPIRNGYHFAGWYSEKHNGEGTLLQKGQPAASWTYYAHWNENHYTLKLNGNGGTTVRNSETVSEYTAKSSLGYAEFFELSNKMFTKEGYILSGWNTRPNGTGVEFAANDSVNMLCEEDDGEATLYAQWHKPDVVITFDAQGGSEVNDRYYTLKSGEGENTYYGELAESAKENYTFLGWFTEPNGGGEHIVNKADKDLKEGEQNKVTKSRTLYANWALNPIITFDANGYDSNNQPVAYFNNNANQHTLPKYYNYGQSLGVLPTPQHGSAVLKGWYTSSALEQGEQITSATKATTSTTYYAHWGYRPQFETDGGTYTDFPEALKYVQEGNSNYTITALPTIEKENSTFGGWYFQDRNISDELKNAAVDPVDGIKKITLDLSSGDHIIAHWTDKNHYEVTLEPNGGNLKADTINPIKVYKGNHIGELPTPTKSGYDFLGWYSDINDENTKHTYETIINSNVTLTAKWAADDYTVTFNPNGGELFDPEHDASQKIAVNKPVKILPGANRSDSTTNYSLDGWFYLDENNVEQKLTLTTPITAELAGQDKTLECYAKWTAAGDLFENAGDNLYGYVVKWYTQSNTYVTNVDDNLIIAPQNGDDSLSAMLFAEFDFHEAISQTQSKTLPANSVKILIPKYVFKDKDGNGIGSNNINVGLYKDSSQYSSDEKCSFIYKDDDSNYPDYYVVYNYEELKEGVNQNQMFKITYELTPSQIRSVNGGYIDENGYYRYVGDDTESTLDDQKYYQANLPIKIMVDRNLNGDYSDALDTDYTKNLGIEMHTKVNATASKTQANASFDWDNSWGDRPDDADQYFYITWTLTSNFDASSSQKFKFTWDESTVHDGSVVYVKSNSGSDWLTKGVYRTTVVTKHPRNPKDSGWKSIYNEAILDVEWLSGHHEAYRVSHTAGVYLLPDGNFQFEKYVENYTENPDRYKKGAQDKILARRSVNNLPYDIEYCEYKNTDNPDWNENTKKYSVPERDIVITDGNKGDVVLSTIRGNDRYNWDCSSNTTLSDSDYSFNTLTVYMTEFDAVKVKTTVQESEVWEWSEPYTHKSLDPENPYVDYTDVEIWTRTEGENDFKLYKTLKNSDFSETIDDPSTSKDERNKYGVVNAAVELPEKTVGYKVRHKSEFFTSKLFIKSNMVLNSSNKVLSLVRDDVSGGYDTLIKNNCTLDAYAWDSTQNKFVGKTGLTNLDSKDTLPGGATICSYELGIGNSYICANMRCKSISADEIKGNFEEFPALMCGWGYTDTEDAVKLIDSGEFNNLLPFNFTVDKDSVYVKPIIGNVDGKSKKENGETNTIGNYVQVSQYNTMQEGKFASAYYSVKFTEDWEGSGRTMMTVDVTTPDGVEASGYYVFFKMKTTLANVSANGITQTDYVSFTDTTENQSPPISKQSNLKNGIDKKYASCYNSIDDKYTAYAQGTTSLVTPSQFATGIKSTVKSEGEFVSKDVTVGLNSDYIYNVTFTNNQPAANIVIYDVLANSLDGKQYAWNGEFKSVDISSLSSDELVSNTDSTAHMAPKIYYCIKDGDLVEDDLDISKTSIWTDVEPTDKSTIKAIAVDCRKDEKGGDYSLKPDKSISFNIQMHSPTSHDENDVYTYNEAHVSGTITGEPFKNVTLTSVLLHYVTPEFHKTSFPQSGTDADHRAGVVIKSTIDYKLAVKNPDETLELHNVVVEDLLDADLTVNNLPKVQMDDEEPVDINKMPQGFISYDISDDSSNGNRKKFTATISSIEAGKTVTLILPATVKENLKLDTPIDNTAKITEVNGNDIDDIISETTYHKVDVTKAKIKKVRSNDEGLAGATLEVYEVNSTNCDENGNLKMSEGDNPVPTGNPKAVTINGTEATSFTSTTDVITFNLAPGDYILHEVSAPATYKTAADIPFTIDVEGVSHVNGESVDFVKMVDEPAFKIIFHENKPNGTIEERNKEFKIVEPMDLVDNKVTHFYDIPEWAGDEYVFAGWYYRLSPKYRIYSSASSIDSNVDTAANFESDTFSGVNKASYTGRDGNYHLYGKWIPVGTVPKDNNDANILESDYRGFGLAGVQIRDAEMWDSNYNNADGTGSTPGGMRFVTSLSESLLSSIDALSSEKVNTEEGNVDVEYGYAVGTEKNIAQFIDGVGNKWSPPVEGHYKGVNLNEYKLQYKGLNVNGVNTLRKDENGNDLPKDQRNVDNDYRYITNVNCTRGTTNSMGTIQDDHRNFTKYRLYTLVVTYEGNSGSYKDEKLDARAYIRYYDANGKLRVFYNNYSGNRYFGGCMCSFNQVAAMALPQDPVKLAEQQKVED